MRVALESLCNSIQFVCQSNLSPTSCIIGSSVSKLQIFQTISFHYFLICFSFLPLQPTNHLDSDTVRALCEALETFEVRRKPYLFFRIILVC